MAFGSNFCTTGARAPSGSVPRIAATACETLFAAASTSVSSLKVITTADWLLTEVVLMSCTPARVLTASSMRRLTSRSTWSGFAPGYAVDTARIGTSKFGSSSTPSRNVAARPARTSSTKMPTENT